MRRTAYESESIRMMRLARRIGQDALSALSGVKRWKIAWAESGRREYTNEEYQSLRKTIQTIGEKWE